MVVAKHVLVNVALEVLGRDGVATIQSHERQTPPCNTRHRNEGGPELEYSRGA
jgi:hypothetical protein